MKRAVLAMMAVALGAFALGRAGAQEGTDPMAEWLKLGTPGPEHAELMKLAGTWDVESKVWTAPGAEPMATKGKATFTPLLGGRYLRCDLEGTFQGNAFHGIGCMGFNNATRKYEHVWIDGMNTGMLITTGTETEPGGWTLTGSCTGPGGREVKMRDVMKRIGTDRMHMESFCDEGGGEMKCWEGTYARSK